MGGNFQIAENVLLQQQQALHQLRERPDPEIAYPPPVLGHEGSSSSTAVPPAPTSVSNNSQNRYLNNPHRPVSPGPAGVGFVRPDINQQLNSNAVISSPVADLIHQQELAPPPEFSPIRFPSWKKEILYYRDLYHYVSDSQIIMTMGPHASPELKRITMSFAKPTRSRPESRTISNLLQLIGDNYASSSRELEMESLDRLLSIRKEARESFQIFWFRFGSLLSSLESHQDNLISEFLFLRPFKALGLSHSQKVAVLMGLDFQQQRHSLQNLRNIAIKLFGTYKTADSTYKPETNAFVAGMELNPEDFPPPLTEDQIYLLPKRKSTRNRPWQEQMAIRKTKDETDLDNDMFLGRNIRRYRCGKPDHVLRQFPLPFTHTLAFAPAKGKPTGKCEGKPETRPFLRPQKREIHRKVTSHRLPTTLVLKMPYCA